MEKLKKKLVNYKKLAGEFQTYFDKFSETIGSYYEEDIKKCKISIDQYSSIVAELSKMTQLKSAKDAFKLVHMMTDMDLVIDDIRSRFEFFNPGKHRFTQEFSTTYLVETSSMFDKIIVAIIHIRQKNKGYDYDVLVYLGAQIMIPFDPSTAMDFFEKIHEHYQEYKYSVSLYAYVVQDMVDRLFAGDKPNRIDAFKIMNLLETDKNNALSEGIGSVKFTGSANNPTLLSFGLIPATGIISMKDAIHKGFNKVISAEDPDEVDPKVLDDLGIANRTGIVIYKKITARPADYEILGLTEKSRVSSSIGVNEYLVNKLRTINILKSDGKYDFSVSTHGMPLDECDSVMIMDELSRGMYKIMSPWTTQAYIIPVHEVFDFVEFSKQGSITKPTRAEYYNKLMIKRMIGTMFLSRSVNVKQISEKSQVEEVKFLRNDLYVRLLARYADIIDDQYGGGSDIKSNKDLIKIVNDPSIKDAFTEILIKNYYAFLKKNEFMGESASSTFVFNEVIATFLAQLRVIIRGFVREIYTYSEVHTPDEAIYKKPFMLMFADVKDIIDKILKDSLAKVLSDKTNIYQSLVYKTMLLNL